MNGATRRLRAALGPYTFEPLAERLTGRSQRRPAETRALLLAAGRTAFSQTGYAARVHEICRAAGVVMGTFFQQIQVMSYLIRILMYDQHQYRVSVFNALAAKPFSD